MKTKLFLLSFFFVSIFTTALSQKENEFIVNAENKNILLKKGMSKLEVKNLLGANYVVQPDKEINCERWIYDQITPEKKNVRIRFKNELLQNVMLFHATTVTVKQDTVTSAGMIIKRPMVTKGGKESACAIDYYLKADKEELFIKLSESKPARDSILKYIDKTVQLKYIVKNGEWDSDGEEHIQSRIGSYIIVLRVN